MGNTGARFSLGLQAVKLTKTKAIPSNNKFVFIGWSYMVYDQIYTN